LTIARGTETLPGSPSKAQPMLSDAEFASLVHVFPALDQLDRTTREVFVSRAIAQDAPTGFAVFEPGHECQNFLWLISGRVRVAAQAESGREILLYRVEPGELCVFTTACLLGHDRYPARGEVESPAHAIFLPAATFEQLMLQSPSLRQLVFRALSLRMHELMGLVEAVAFHKVDQRLAQSLLDRARASGGNELHCTHQELADEVGTAREIVSRVLANFETAGMVRLSRRLVVITDEVELTAVGGSN
jgi:CRP/FNR family transcriptional regulator, anaerobic regulatory protein